MKTVDMNIGTSSAKSDGKKCEMQMTIKKILKVLKWLSRLKGQVEMVVPSSDANSNICGQGEINLNYHRIFEYF